MKKNIFLFVYLIFIFLSLYIFLTKKFFYGIDIAGGTILTYEIDKENLKEKKLKDALEESKDLIERRINFLGVAEFNVNYTEGGKILVEIPNIKNPEEAIKIIGDTPFLEFKIPGKKENEFLPSGLTGEYLKKAELSFNPQTYQPIVVLYFNEKGKEIFKNLTKEYLGKPIAIYLDGKLISSPVVRDVIENGVAEISGNFTVEEAKILANRLNQGALPAPLKLISVSLVNPLLGEKFLELAIKASILGFILVTLFMIIVYRFSGLLASIALIVFTLFNVSLYKVLGVTLSLASLSGLVLAIGMAVDANILIFERRREEFKKGKSPEEAIEEGFKRAFPSIRDSNITTIISSSIIYFLASSFVKGFALTLLLGVIISFLTAVIFTKHLIELSIFVYKKWPNLA